MDTVSSSSLTSSHIPYMPPLPAYYGERNAAYTDAWGYESQQPEDSYAQSSHPSQTMSSYATSAASPHSMASPSDTPSPQGQDSRLSMGEAQNNISDIETSHRSASPLPHNLVRKKTIDRNRRPCGNCSSSKRKCKLISNTPHLCERCKNHGLQECPPHISWTRRKESVSGSLSPQEGDDRSSRSASPPYLSSHASPIPMHTNLAGGNIEFDPEAPFGSVRTQQPQLDCWPQLESTAEALHVNANVYEMHVSPPSVVISQYPQGPFISIYDLKNLVCHACNTPYDFSGITINCDINLASVPSSEGVALHTSYAQMPPEASTSSTYRSHTW